MALSERLNPTEHVRVVQFKRSVGERLSARVKAMVAEGLKSSTLLEPYNQSKNNLMLQYRPRARDVDYEVYMQREQTSSDTSTNVSGCPRPPLALAELLNEIDVAAPWLLHYEAGWCQVNLTHKAKGDELRPHIDKLSWGDIIVVFTTQDITLTLSNGTSENAIKHLTTTIAVPANACYILAGHSRSIATHTVKMHPGRIGVVFRLHKIDSCLLGKRALRNAHASRPCVEVYQRCIGSEVVARWPSECSPHEIDSKYRSSYPGRLLAVEGDDCLVEFFQHDGDTGLHRPAEEDDRLSYSKARKVKYWMVLLGEESTGWFNDHRDPNSLEFMENLESITGNGRQVTITKLRPNPPRRRLPITDDNEEDGNNIRKKRNERVPASSSLSYSTLINTRVLVEKKRKKTDFSKPTKREIFSHEDDIDENEAMRMAIAESQKDVGKPFAKEKNCAARGRPKKKPKAPMVVAPILEEEDSWEQTFDFEPKIYDNDEKVRRLAAFLHSRRELRRTGTAWAGSDSSFDAPDLGDYFNIAGAPVPSRADLIALATRHLDAMRDLVANNYDTKIAPLIVAASNPGSRSRRREPPKEEEEKRGPTFNMSKPKRGDQVLVWHSAHKLWVPANLVDTANPARFDLAIGTTLRGYLEKTDLRVSSEKDAHDLALATKQPFMAPNERVQVIRHTDKDTSILLRRFRQLWNQRLTTKTHQDNVVVHDGEEKYEDQKHPQVDEEYGTRNAPLVIDSSDDDDIVCGPS